MRTKGFTLIELLVVVAIIAILAAIAIPNMQLAHVRSKVARAKADLNSLAKGLESYAVDHNTYPVWAFDAGRGEFADAEHPFRGFTPLSLTTPLAYLTTLPKDPFNWEPNISFSPQINPLHLYMYDSQTNWDLYNVTNSSGESEIKSWDRVAGSAYRWVMVSSGPDGVTTVPNGFGPTDNIVEVFQIRDPNQYGWFVGFGCNYYYDPTNGTTSEGEIVLCGPGGDFDFHQTTYISGSYD